MSTGVTRETLPTIVPDGDNSSPNVLHRTGETKSKSRVPTCEVWWKLEKKVENNKKIMAKTLVFTMVMVKPKNKSKSDPSLKLTCFSKFLNNNFIYFTESRTFCHAGHMKKTTVFNETS